MDTNTPNISDITAFYDNYADRLKIVNNRHLRVFRSLDMFIPRETKVLDVGCGTGITSRYLASRSRQVTAVDISPKLIECAKGQDCTGVEYIVCDIAKYQPNDVFDAIVLVDILEHMYDFDGLFQMLFMCSHKNTVIYVNIPTANVLSWLLENRPDLTQLIDNPIKGGDLIEKFGMIGFVPSYFQLYWKHYEEYLFVTKESQNKTFNDIFKEPKNG